MSDEVTHDGVNDLIPNGYRCPRCRRETGFKYVSKFAPPANSRGGEPDGPEDLRGSCRFCGYVRKDARLSPGGEGEDG